RLPARWSPRARRCAKSASSSAHRHQKPTAWSITPTASGGVEVAKLKVGILISGRGSNMAALIEAARDPSYPAKIACVVSNVASAAGLEIAKKAGIAAVAIPHKDYADRESFDRAVSAA